MLENTDGRRRSGTSRRELLLAGVVLGLAGGAPPALAAMEAQGLPRDVVPFQVRLDPAAIDDLRRRLRNTRWPDHNTVGGWAEGVPLEDAKALVRHWADVYDMGRLERRLNAHPQCKADVDGLGIHFLHVRSRHPGALPMIMTHGWPGSVVEFLDVIDPLVDPTAHGGTEADAFHVVVPSMPGFGFSEKPREAGWDIPRIARAWAVLMSRLGYDHYVAQGGDLGASVASWMSRQAPAGLAAIHLNLPVLFPPPPPGPNGYSPEERVAVDQLVDAGAHLLGYATIQGQRPQTLGYGLADSPAGQAAWIYEKFQAWTDNDGDPTSAIALDDMLDDITLYWVTDTAASAARLYRESFVKDFHRIELDGPVAVSVFKHDIYTAPRIWGESTYHRLDYWNQLEHGGHFAAMEQPRAFVEELRKSLRAYRRA